MENSRIRYVAAAAVVLVLTLTPDVALCRRHVISKRTLFSEPTKAIPGPEKNYTGIRVRKDSLLVAYHSEQTVAVVEVGDERELLNCEIMEVRTKPDKVATLASLYAYAPTQIKIAFSDMNDLMQHCQLLGHPRPEHREKKTVRVSSTTPDPRGLVSVLRGVFPGTKWCGAGDLADTYYDLGPYVYLDKCCRTHDLCPVKVPGLRTQYNLTNYSPYTRSHCDCDEIFYRCLKKVKTNVSDLLGNLYFNLATPVCVEDVTEQNRVVRRQFATRAQPY